MLDTISVTLISRITINGWSSMIIKLKNSISRKWKVNALEVNQVLIIMIMMYGVLDSEKTLKVPTC